MLNKKVFHKRTALIGISILTCMSVLLFFALLSLYYLSILGIGYLFIPLLLILLAILTLFIVFSQLTNLFPLNTLSDDTYKNIKSQYLKDKNVVLHIFEREVGKWYVDENFYFNMKGYIFPKKYICSYFIRNIHYPIINKNKFKLAKLFRSLETEDYENFYIYFHSFNKVKKCIIVKNSKTKLIPLNDLIILSRFYLDVLNLHNKEIMSYVPIGEDVYNSLKK